MTEKTAILGPIFNAKKNRTHEVFLKEIRQYSSAGITKNNREVTNKNRFIQMPVFGRSAHLVAGYLTVVFVCSVFPSYLPFKHNEW
jgi:hypothetical protein